MSIFTLESGSDAGDFDEGPEEEDGPSDEGSVPGIESQNHYLALSFFHLYYFTRL